MTTTELPKFQSDGFRQERCAVCGNRIGYAEFWATRMTLNAQTAPHAVEGEVSLIHGHVGQFGGCRS